MKVFVAALLVLSIFCGCSTNDEATEQALNLRKELILASSCSFHTEITADYGDAVQSFQMDCMVDQDGNLSFTVTSPESISGISGQIAQEGASLTFDDTILAFPMLADDQISPICSPWLFMNALRGGYLSGCSKEDNGLCIYIDDSFHDYPLRFEVYTDTDTIPYHVDFIWQDRRILSLNIQNIIIL